MRPGPEHDALGGTPFIEGLALRPLAGRHEQHAERGAAQVADVSAETSKRL